MNKVKNILVTQSRIEILVTVRAGPRSFRRGGGGGGGGALTAEDMYRAA